MAGRSHSLNNPLRRRIAGLVGAVIRSEGQGLKALPVVLGGGLAGGAWGLAISQVAG